jgi:hypothetical protein
LEEAVIAASSTFSEWLKPADLLGFGEDKKSSFLTLY